MREREKLPMINDELQLEVEVTQRNLPKEGTKGKFWFVTIVTTNDYYITVILVAHDLVISTIFARAPMAARWLISLILTVLYSHALGSQHVFTADPSSVTSIKNNGVVRRFDIESTLQQVLITAQVRLACSSIKRSWWIWIYVGARPWHLAYHAIVRRYILAPWCTSSTS